MNGSTVRQQLFDANGKLKGRNLRVPHIVRFQVVQAAKLNLELGSKVNAGKARRIKRPRSQA